MWIPWIIKAFVWVGKLAVENFVTAYAKKQASKIKYKFKKQKHK
jgi:hypothetical protein